MQTLNRTQSIELHNALSQKGLKAKHISGENFIKLINLKSLLKNKLSELQEAEEALAEEEGATQTQFGYLIDPKVTEQGLVSGNPEKNAEFVKSMREKQKAFKVECELHFVPQKELEEYCKEQDTEITATLFEYLLLAK